MIEGTVNASREAVVPLTVASPAGRMQPIDAVIDTGFNGFLTLPAALVSELRLPFVLVAARPWPTAAKTSLTFTTPWSYGTASRGRFWPTWPTRRRSQACPCSMATACT